MSQFLLDNLTGTAGSSLTTHAPDTGGTWHQEFGIATDALLGTLNGVSGAVAQSANGDVVYYNEAAPGTADYSVVATFVVGAVGTGSNWGNFGPTGRASGGTYYWGTWDSTGSDLAGEWQIYAVVGGSATKIGSVGDALAQNASYAMTLAMTGTAIALSVNGTQKVAVTDSTIAATGDAGFRFNDAQGGKIVLDSISAASSTTPPAENLIPYTDAHIVASPYNTYDNGTASMMLCGGAYKRFNFYGTSLKIRYDASKNTNVRPILIASIDNGQPVVVPTDSSGEVVLASGLASGQHSARVILQAIDHQSRWNNPADALCVLGFVLDAGGQLATPTVPKWSKTVWLIGDSITEGCGILPGSDDTSSADRSDATQSTFRLVAEAVASGLGGAEIGSVNYQAQGWTQGGQGGVPGLSTAYSQMYSGVARSFATQPDAIVIGHGTNGDPGASAILGVLQSIRTACPGAKVYVCVPPSGSDRASITSAFGSWADANSRLVDLGTSNDLPLGVVGFYTYDGYHPTARGAAHYGALYTSKISQGAVPVVIGF